MSDQRLRELERRWKETGSPDDEAAYLLERVRVGDLTRERLELAAYCGHEGATVATESPRAKRVSLAEWVAGVVRHGRLAVLQLAVVAMRHALDGWSAVDPARVRNSTFLAGAPLSVPAPFDVAEIPGLALRELKEEVGREEGPSQQAVELFERASRVRFLGGFAAEQGGFGAYWAFQTTLDALGSLVDPANVVSAVDRLFARTPDSPVNRDLIPWALDENTGRQLLAKQLAALALDSPRAG